MRRKNNYVLSLLIVLLTISFVGCMGQVKLTEDATEEDYERAKYFVALRAFNDLVEDYIRVYNLSTPETKQKFVDKIKPLVSSGYTALDTWKAAIGSATSVEKREAYIKAKDDLIVLLFQFGILELKE